MNFGQNLRVFYYNIEKLRNNAGNNSAELSVIIEYRQ